MIDQGVTTALAARDANRSTNGDDSHVSGTGLRRTERVARECTYPDFMKCQPLNFKGTEGVVELIQWFEKMEIVFSISNYSVENQIKFSTYLKKKMTDKYCPRIEIKKLEAELWNLKVKESDKIERYVDGFPDMIHGSVVASKPKTMQEAIKIATELMDKKIRTLLSVRQRTKESTMITNNNNDKKTRGKTPAGLTLRDLEHTPVPHCLTTKRGHSGSQKPTYCYEDGARDTSTEDCPKLKNNNRGNQAGNGNALAKVYVVGRAGTNPDSNVLTGTFLLNNRYAFVLFNTGADRSIASTTFSSQIDITPTALDHYYDVELADERIN
ncbi:hypothetical protein Tco_0469459 [Tanacetum coccineum]